MTTSCPKCHHIRHPSESAVPDWQCPACGVAYVKAAEAAQGRAPQVIQQRMPPAAKPASRGVPWTALTVVLAVVVGAWWGQQALQSKALPGGGRAVASAGADLTDAQIRALAATVQAEDVVMYSTTDCTYCAQAKGWLSQYGFPLSECNMTTTPHCEQAFRALGADGTPYLIVRGHHMKNGFDSDEFLAALR
ncbi:MAG: glutaredoxin family protein [Aquabacterium sp.]|uniref:glutaredoxin family protein n=1 Tax=Aquabacterium sp. TaxID=1872578 RepID=UPI0025C1DB65|nr:glutaredoxin family protein [Aquabacterium sp.]MBI5924509.1 glutaredoxin family protein [Aquabacterium sp.]